MARLVLPFLVMLQCSQFEVPKVHAAALLHSQLFFRSFLLTNRKQTRKPTPIQMGPLT